MNFKLTHFGTTAICLDDGKEHSIVYSPVYLEWVANGGVPLPADTEGLAKEARLKRNALISQADWTQLPDAPLTADQKALWVKYRQDLRDISSPTSNPGFPSEIIWPTKPA